MTHDERCRVVGAVLAELIRQGHVPPWIERDDLTQAAHLALWERRDEIGDDWTRTYMRSRWAIMEEVRREYRQARPVAHRDDVDAVTPERWAMVAQALRLIEQRLAVNYVRVIGFMARGMTPTAATRALGLSQAMASLARRQARVLIAEAI